MFALFRKHFWKAAFSLVAMTFVALFVWAHNTLPLANATVSATCSGNGVNVTSGHAWSFENAGHGHNYTWEYRQGVYGVGSKTWSSGNLWASGEASGWDTRKGSYAVSQGTAWAQTYLAVEGETPVTGNSNDYPFSCDE